MRGHRTRHIRWAKKLLPLVVGLILVGGGVQLIDLKSGSTNLWGTLVWVGMLGLGVVYLLTSLSGPSIELRKGAVIFRPGLPGLAVYMAAELRPAIDLRRRYYRRIRGAFVVPTQEVSEFACQQGDVYQLTPSRRVGHRYVPCLALESGHSLPLFPFMSMHADKPWNLVDDLNRELPVVLAPTPDSTL